MRRYIRPWADPWHDRRHEFRAAVDDLSTQLPKRLSSMRLSCWRPDFWSCEEQTRRMPNLLGDDNEDPVSVALRTLAAPLEGLNVRAILTPDIFRPPVAWPRMRRLKVEFNLLSPDGTWYFAGPRDEDPFGDEGGFAVDNEKHYPSTTTSSAEDKEADESWPEFRTESKPDKVEPPLLAYAAAPRGMPALEEAELFARLSWQPSEERLLAYRDANGELEVPHDVANPHFLWRIKYVPGAEGKKGLLTWQVGDWRPDEKVIQAFEAVGGENGIEVEWKEFEYLPLGTKGDDEVA
ncbi:hypothetical protein MAPG_11446 [Magnaporthiopsis poae ATCC 64411]|uniref:Uncharacterized protein n=1 Tax=Magnaporthiopsis poae (strain ATCC 64411 / 73-15) TaxID=644358 RepID=A0A0C4EFA7_MAGP6|nr:hypothetical protein MAPG_11446 [Magnaporthiopsis poae ATCC 64411]